MNRFFVGSGKGRIVVAACALLGWAALADLAVARSPLVGRSDATRSGLKRAWFTQLGVDPARSEVSRWRLYMDRLYGVTTSGTAFSIDAQTGQRLWIRQISPPGRAAFGPSANQQYVAVVSGSKLYLLDRADGRTRSIRDLGSAPGAGPALSETYAYVAMVTGRIEGYDLSNPDSDPWYYQSKGRSFAQPTATGSVVSWPTDAGHLYVSRADVPHVLYRLETDDEIVASPTELSPYLYVAALDGYLYCIDEISGAEAWRFSTGYAIEDAPAVVGDTAYVGSFQPALHAVDVATGAELWQALGLSQFVAQGKDRVYAADRMGHLAVLDRKTGARLATIQLAEGIRPLVNDKTDRIYLVNPNGLIQCLHEIGVDEPILYREPPKAPEEESETPSDGASDAAEEENPFVEEEGPVEENPFVDEDAAADDEPMEADDEPADEVDDVFNLFE